jgi:hypothetical protein
LIVIPILSARDGEENVAAGWHAIEFPLWGQDLSETSPGNRSFEDYVDGKRSNADRRRQYLKVVTSLQPAAGRAHRGCCAPPSRHLCPAQAAEAAAAVRTHDDQVATGFRGLFHHDICDAALHDFAQHGLGLHACLGGGLAAQGQQRLALIGGRAERLLRRAECVGVLGRTMSSYSARASLCLPGARSVPKGYSGKQPVKAERRQMDGREVPPDEDASRRMRTCN